MPSTSSSRMMMYSVPSSLVSLPEYFPKRMRSPVLTSRATSFPSSSRLPWPTAMTSPSWGFSFAESGMMMPCRVVSCSSIRFTTMRSYRGRIFMLLLASGNLSSASPRGSVVLDRLVAGVVKYHLPHLIAYLLPVVNEIASLIFPHHFGSFVFQDRDDGFRFGTLYAVLVFGHRPE